jgi:hypothetical protein
MDDNIKTLLSLNSFVYKFCAAAFIRKQNINMQDLLMIYGLMVHAFNIEFYLELTD